MNKREASNPDIDFRSWVPERVIPGTVYELLQAPIGEGGYGRIYKVRHRETGRICALKALHRDLVQREDILQRLRQEVRTIATILPHPNLVDIYDAGYTSDGRFFYVMELLEGRNLRRAISKGDPLDVLEACHVIRQVLFALDRAHEHGIVHRDIKPDNIFLVGHAKARGDIVKLLDFGVAKVFGSTTVHTAPGSIVGTYHYFAPENVQGAPITPQTDIYALGVTFWEALTGEHPFPHESQYATLTAIVREGVPPLSALPRMAKRVPKAVCEVVRWATATAPEKRFPTAAVFLEALDEATGGPPPRLESATTGRRSSAPPAASPRVNPSRESGPTSTDRDVVTPWHQQEENREAPASPEKNRPVLTNEHLHYLTTRTMRPDAPGGSATPMPHASSPRKTGSDRAFWRTIVGASLFGTAVALAVLYFDFLPRSLQRHPSQAPAAASGDSLPWAATSAATVAVPVPRVTSEPSAVASVVPIVPVVSAPTTETISAVAPPAGTVETAASNAPVAAVAPPTGITTESAPRPRKKRRPRPDKSPQDKGAMDKDVIFDPFKPTSKGNPLGFAAPMWTLTLEDEDGDVQTIALEQTSYLLGRGAENDVVLPERTLSRRHARLERDQAGRWWLHDLGSRYGCYVNGQRIADSVILRPTDIAQLGGFCLGLVPATGEADVLPPGTPPPRPWSPATEPDQIYVFDGPDAGREIPLAGHQVTFGVGEGCSVQLPAGFAPIGVHAVVRPLAGGRFEVLRRSDAIAIRVRLRLVARMLLDDQDLIRIEDTVGTGEVRVRFLAARRVRLTGLGTPREGTAPRDERRPIAEANLEASPTLAEVDAALARQPDNWRVFVGLDGAPHYEVVRGPPLRNVQRRRRLKVLAVVFAITVAGTGMAARAAFRARAAAAGAPETSAQVGTTASVGEGSVATVSAMTMASAGTTAPAITMARTPVTVPAASTVGTTSKGSKPLPSRGPRGLGEISNPTPPSSSLHEPSFPIRRRDRLQECREKEESECH